MVGIGHISEPPPLEVTYLPQIRDRRIPVEVVDRSELLSRIVGRELSGRQRADFHQLLLCTEGSGVHHVDYEAVQLSAGTLMWIHPGQVQRFAPDSCFAGTMVVWPIESHRNDPMGRPWYPGCGVPVSWRLDRERFDRILDCVEQLRVEQDHFDGSARYIELMRSILHMMLLRISIDIPESSPDVSRLPRPYVDFREVIEKHLYERPTVAELASEVGYSSRTIDRACQQVTGQTARQVLDQRVAFEVRRLLTHTTRPVARIGLDFGFNDPSNFSKFVKRHLGRTPGHIRDDPAAANS